MFILAFLVLLFVSVAVLAESRLYRGGEIRGQKVRADSVLRHMVDTDENAKSLYNELRKMDAKYTHPTSMLEYAIMQENQEKGTIGDGYITVKQYRELEQSLDA